MISKIWIWNSSEIWFYKFAAEVGLLKKKKIQGNIEMSWEIIYLMSVDFESTGFYCETQRSNFRNRKTNKFRLIVKISWFSKNIKKFPVFQFCCQPV